MHEHIKGWVAGVFCGVAFTVSCGGITQNVELLRARRIELVDASERLEVDVGAELKALRARIDALEKLRASSP